MERLTEKQLETRIHAFLARKTDQMDIENPIENIEPADRWQPHRRAYLPSFSRDQFAR